MKSRKLNIGIWIAQGFLILAMLFFGIMKIITPYEESVAHPNGAWMADFSPNQIAIIGILEILGVVGLLLPYLTKRLKMLVPIAAIALAITLAGGVFTHVLRGENFAPPFILMIIALIVAFGRKEMLRFKTTSN